MTRRTRVAVAGLPRSGTSWLARGLSLAEGLTYYREPDNHDHVPGASPRFPFLYLPAGADDAEYRQHMQRALSGEVATHFTMSQDPGPLLRRLPKNWWPMADHAPLLFWRGSEGLVKLVNSNLALDFLLEHFPATRQVYIVRHPCGQFASWRRQGWTPKPERLLEDARLVADHLASLEDHIRSAEGFWSKAGAWWGAVNRIVHRQSQKRPERLVVTFEWLCAAPLAHYRQLFDRLGLQWTVAAEHFLQESNRPGKDKGKPYSLVRDASQEATKWKREVDAADIAACRAAAEPFELPYYPNFEPEPSAPSWS